MKEQPNIKELIGHLVKKYRKERAFTQQDLADALNVDRQYISKIEKGKINLTLDYLDKIISKLGCNYKDFLTIVPI